MRLEVPMNVLRSFVGAAIVLALIGCASEPDAGPESAEPAAVVSEQTTSEAATPPAEAIVVEVLEGDEIAMWLIGDGSPVADGTSITLATGGAASGQLIPGSSDASVTLYLTRDGSRPSAENNWGGPVDPSDPMIITRQSEGSGTYKVVAERDGMYSGVTTVYVTWRHEENPPLDAPVFKVGGRPVSGTVEIPVSDGSDEDRRLAIISNYRAATLYISRDGTDPTPDRYWQSQVADGTYLFSSEPTAAAYRVIAVWQDVVSPVASLDVIWVE